MPSRQQYIPQNPSALDVCLHNYDTERGNMKICNQHLPLWPFSAFYCHHRLSQMRHLALSYYETKGMTGNWWTCYHFHEGHGSVYWRCFFCVFYHPLHRFLQCDWLNIMAQFAIIPDNSIIAINFSKWEGKGPHRTLIFSKTSLVNHLMVLKESTVYVFLRFPHTLISKIVYLHHSHFRLLLLYFFLVVNR